MIKEYRQKHHLHFFWKSCFCIYFTCWLHWRNLKVHESVNFTVACSRYILFFNISHTQNNLIAGDVLTWMMWRDDMMWRDVMTWCDNMTWSWCDTVMWWRDVKSWCDVRWCHDMTLWQDVMTWRDVTWWPWSDIMTWCDVMMQCHDMMMWCDIMWCHDVMWHHYVTWRDVMSWCEVTSLHHVMWHDVT